MPRWAAALATLGLCTACSRAPQEAGRAPLRPGKASGALTRTLVFDPLQGNALDQGWSVAPGGLRRAPYAPVLSAFSAGPTLPSPAVGGSAVADGRCLFWLEAEGPDNSAPKVWASALDPAAPAGLGPWRDVTPAGFVGASRGAVLAASFLLAARLAYDRTASSAFTVGAGCALGPAIDTGVLPPLGSTPSLLFAHRGRFFWAAESALHPDDSGAVGSLYFLQYGFLFNQGTVGDFLPAGTHRLQAGLAHYLGTLYVTGGVGSAPGVSTAADALTLGSDGVPGPLRSLPALPRARSGHRAVVVGGRLLLVGGAGADGQTLSQIDAAPVLSGGDLGAWSTTDAPEAARRGAAAVSLGDRLVLLGGAPPGGGAPDGAVLVARALEQSAPEPWLGLLGPEVGLSRLDGRADMGFAADQRQLTEFGGATASALADTAYSGVNLDTGYAWPGKLPDPRARFAAAAWGPFAYGLGGLDEAGAPARSVTLVDSDTPAALARILPQDELAAARSGSVAAVAGGRLFLLGGRSAGGLLADTLSAPLQADGSVGAWTTSTPLPEPREDAAIGAHRGRLYLLGGTGPAGATTQVWVGAIGGVPWGSAITWTAGPHPLPEPRAGLRAAVAGGVLYVAGGSASTVALASVLGADGAPGPWVQAGELAADRTGHGLAVAGGKLLLAQGRSFDGGALRSDRVAAQVAVPALEAELWSRLDLGVYPTALHLTVSAPDGERWDEPLLAWDALQGPRNAFAGVQRDWSDTLFGPNAAFEFTLRARDLATASTLAGGPMTTLSALRVDLEWNPPAALWVGAFRALAGNCSQGGLQVGFLDAAGKPALDVLDHAVHLDAPGLSFWNAAALDCYGASTGPDGLLAAGQPKALFTFKPGRSGSYPVSATAPGFAAVSTALVVRPGGASSMAWTTQPSRGTAGALLPPAAVTLYDAYGDRSASDFNQQVTVRLEQADGGAADLGGTLTVGDGQTGVVGFDALTVGAGQAGAGYRLVARYPFGAAFEVRSDPFDVALAAPDAGPADGGLDGGSNAGSDGGSDAGPSGPALRFSAAPLVTIRGRCAGPVPIALLDAAGAPTTSARDLAVLLAGEGLTFFDASGCAGPAVGQTPLRTGEAAVRVWFIADRAGSLTLTASAAGLAPVTQVESVAERYLDGLSGFSCAAAPGPAGGLLPALALLAGRRRRRARELRRLHQPARQPPRASRR